MGMQEKNKIIIKKVAIIFFIILGLIYVFGAMYFKSHFYLRTSINLVDVSGKLLNESNEKMISELDSYGITITGKNDFNTEIKGADIGLEYDLSNSLEEIKNKQNPFGWLSCIFGDSKYTIEASVNIDEDKLKEKLNSLDIFNENNMVKPINASFKFECGKYNIIPEDDGSYLDKEIVYEKIKNAIGKGEKTLNLIDEKCYSEATLRADSDEAKNILDTLNKYVSTKVIYKLNGKENILDSNTINTWLSVNDDNDVVIDEDKVKSYISELAKPYSSVGKKRDFKSSVGKTISVSGGDYGKNPDITDEINELISMIKEGKEFSREPEFSIQTASNGYNDIGDTYVEINLSRQYLWFYKNGKLLTEGSVVTGNLSQKNGTPSGIYKLKYKEKNAVLVGVGYRTPVSFWMPFNGGIGMHDATWRGQFGGNIYKTSGSHGCINCPYNLAKTIFDNINPGTAVVCYNE